MTFQRRSDPKGNNRAIIFIANPHRLGDFLRIFRKHNCIWPLLGNTGGCVTMMRAHRLTGRELFSKSLFQFRDRVINFTFIKHENLPVINYKS